MIINRPAAGQIPQLRQLWQEAFGDEDAFLDTFFQTAYSPDRCLCATLEGQVAAALYWLDCEYRGQKLAYLYAVATAECHRHKGLCHALVADAHRILKEQGYAGSLLVPQDPALMELYRSMGYEDCTRIKEFVCGPQLSDLQITRVHPAEYARLRRTMLPAGGVVQEGPSLELLAAQGCFYTGNGFLLCGYVKDDTLHGMELLGDITVAPALVSCLGCAEGHFRSPGNSKPFAMYRSFGSVTVPAPAYFGLSFD